MMNRCSRNRAVIAILVAMCMGCGGATPKPKTVQAKVNGIVTSDGKPLPADSEVVFLHVDTGGILGAKCDMNGNYKLAPADPKIGIPVGKYKIAIRASGGIPVKIGTQEYKDRMMGTAPPTAESVVPNKFKDFESTPITWDVKPDYNDVTIELSKY